MAYLAPDTIGGGPYLSPDEPPGVVTPTITGISISPPSAVIASGGSRHFAATLTGTGAYSSAVTWAAPRFTVDAGGNVSGATGTGTLTATSVQDGSFTASATFTILAPGVASPAPALAVSTIMRRSTANLTATLTGSINLTANLL